jgi:hypothetical protein
MFSLMFPDSGNIIEAWVRHRFTTGNFELPNDGTTKPPAYSTVESMLKADDAEAVRQIQNSPELVNALQVLPRDTAARVLDAVLSARLYHSVERRATERVKACIYLFKRRVDSDDVSLTETRDYDLLDASVVLGADEAARLWLTVNQ